MRKYILYTIMTVFLLLGIGGLLLYARAPSSPRVKPSPSHSAAVTATPPVPAPSIGATSAIPTIVGVNTPTTVTVTSVITDPALITTGINLLRLNANGTSTILGQLRDDGLNGDALAGDKTFSINTTFNEPQTGQIQLQVSAAFRGILKRALSTVITVDVGHVFQDQTLGITFTYPHDWTVSDSGNFINLVSPGTSNALAHGEVETPLDITITILNNPNNLAIDSFADGYEGYAYYASKNILQINGRSAIRYSDIGSTVGHAPMVATFVSDGSRVFLFTLNPYASNLSLTIVPLFDALVASTHIQ